MQVLVEVPLTSSSLGDESELAKSVQECLDLVRLSLNVYLCLLQQIRYQCACADLLVGSSQVI